MKRAVGLTSPLVIEWSPTRVKVFDSAARSVQTGEKIADCVPAGGGRDVIVAVSQGSSFIRSLPLPNISRDEVAKLLAFKLAPLLPLGIGEYSYGYRLGSGGKARSHVAIVGAVKTDSLRRIHHEVEAAGLRLCAVLPLAFGSWLAARSRHLSDGAVIHMSDDVMTIDVVKNGELGWSRSVPLPESAEEAQDQIDRSFKLAETAPTPILAMGETPFSPEYVESREPLSFLADLKSLEKLLFSLELPESSQARSDRSAAWAARRAIAAAALALVFAGYTFQQKKAALDEASRRHFINESSISGLKPNLKSAELETKSLQSSASILQAAFKPAQRFVDIIATLNGDATPKSWLTGLTLERGKPVQVRGQATDGNMAAKYADQLDSEPRFKGMKLMFLTKSLIGTKPVVRFAISGHAVGNLPLDQAIPDEKTK